MCRIFGKNTNSIQSAIKIRNKRIKALLVGHTLFLNVKNFNIEEHDCEEFLGIKMRILHDRLLSSTSKE